MFRITRQASIRNVCIIASITENNWNPNFKSWKWNTKEWKQKIAYYKLIRITFKKFFNILIDYIFGIVCSKCCVFNLKCNIKMSRAQRFLFKSGFAFRLHLKSKRSDTASLWKQNCNVDLWAYNNIKCKL